MLSRYCYHTVLLMLASVAALLVPTSGAMDDSRGVVTRAELQKLLEKVRAKQEVAALAAGIFRPSQEPVLAVVGVRKHGNEAAATLADEWHLGSNTKPITALLIALLIEQGLLDWDTPLAEIFPEEADKWDADVKKITPAHLLTHTSGLPPAGPLSRFLIFRWSESPQRDRDSLVRSLQSVKLERKLGEKYAYSNLGYVVLGAIADRRGKASWEDQVQKKIFLPLGIKSWRFGPPEGAKADGQPWPHWNRGKPLAPAGILDNPPVMNPAGRLCLSAPDYGRFLVETLKLARGEKGLLKPATAQKFFSNPYPVSPHSLAAWAGFRKQAGDKGLVLRHDGSNNFNYCAAIVDVDQNLALCVLTNQGGPEGPGAKACHEVRKELKFK